MSEFDSAIGRLRNLEVDVAHLDIMSTYLTTLVEAIDTIRDRTLWQAHRLAYVGGNPGSSEVRDGGGGGGGESALGSSLMEENVVTDLSTREQGTYNALDGGLRAIADELTKAADGITEIAEQYDTVEERNALTAAQWTEAISS